MKNKGFTMVELLATVTILGILSVTAVTSVNFLINKGKKNFTTSQRNNLISAAKSYYQANRSKLPKDIGTSKSVSYGELKNKKFIGKMYASDKSTECNPSNTKVVVTLIDKNNYKYKGYLDCGSEHDTVSNDVDNSVNFTLTPVAQNDTTYRMNIKPDPNAAGTIIKSYSFNVLKNNYSYVGPISDKTNSSDVTTKTFVIDLKDQKQTNNFIVSMHIVYTLNGKTGEKNVNYTLPINDKTGPTCSLVNAGRTTWSKSAQTLTFKCSDVAAAGGYASGCQKDTYKVVIKTLADVNKYKNNFKIYDKAGNEGVCPIKDSIRVDLVAPKCPNVNGYIKKSATNVTSASGLPGLNSGAWTDKWIFTVASGSTDRAFGAEDDNIGGRGAKGVYYKLTAAGKTTPANNVNASYRNVNAEGKSTVTYQACDSLGNCTTNCPGFAANIDHGPPNVPTVYLYKWKTSNAPTSTSGLSSYTNNQWLSGRVYTVASGSSDTGIGGVYYQYVTTGKTRNDTNATASTRNIEAQGKSYIKYRACDALNKCSGYSSTYTIKLDRTPPEYVSQSKGVNHSIGSWEWKMTWKDPLSGLATIADAGVDGGVSSVYYCYGTCSRKCTSYPHGANTHPGTMDQTAGLYLKKARVADRTKEGNTENDLIVMQTNYSCNGGDYTVRAEAHIHDIAGNVAKKYLTWDFD